MKTTMLLLATLGICVPVLADTLAIGTAGGNLFLRDEYDLTIGQTSTQPLGAISAIAADVITGNIVVATTDGVSGQLHSFNAANISNRLYNGPSLGAGTESLSIDANGNLLVAGMDIDGRARVDQRQIPDVASTPVGYPYPSIPLGANGSALVAAADGTNFFAVAKDVGIAYYRTYDWGRPIAQPYDYVDWGGPVNAVASTSQGYAVFGTASGFALENSVWIRGIAEGTGLWYPPTGYEATTGNFGSAVTALAVTPDDNVIIGLANGHVSIRPANALTTTIASINLGTSISAMAMTSNGNIAIGTGNQVEVYSSDLSVQIDTLNTGNTVTALAVVPEPTTLLILSAGVMAVLRRRRLCV